MDKPLFPLDAPGLALPGQDFIDAANRLLPAGEEAAQIVGKGRNQEFKHGKTLRDLIYNCLYNNGMTIVPITVKPGTQVDLNIVAGHRWNIVDENERQGRTTGPEPCEIMLIGKMLGDLELSRGRLMCGPTGRLFRASLQKLRIIDLASDWYITTIGKVVCPDPSGKWKDAYTKTFLHLLHQELKIVRPKYIICLGADALKALFGKHMTMAKCEGQVLEYEIDLRKSADEEPNSQTALVMGCIHPAAVLHTPEKQSKMEQTIARFIQLTKGERWDLEETDLDHRLIDNEDDLVALVKEIRSHGKNQLIAIDAEWHGDHPQNDGAYLRTIQVSWKHKTAACIVLNDVGGVPAFYRNSENGPTTEGGFQLALKLFGLLMKGQRPCGHYLAADLEWLTYYGLTKIAEAFAPPKDWDWLCRAHGGLDTALMAHAVDETGDFSLTAQALQRTSAPRYDVALVQWKENYCKLHGIKAKDLDGYGMCPPEILYPYALYDADVTRRIAIALMDELDSDAFGNNCWKPFWISQKAVLGTLEMKQTGICVDMDKVDEMTSVYMEAKQRLANKIRKQALWPELNPESVYQIREFLFGACYNGSRNDDGTVKRLRPPTARSLQAVPMMTTEKRPRAWRLLHPDERKQLSPSTNKTALGMMVHYGKRLAVRRRCGIVRRDRQEAVQAIRDYRFISQVLKSVLRPPLMDDDGILKLNDKGRLCYKGGIPGSVCGDGRIRTTTYQTKETGRWSSARPPVQNLCVDADTEYLTEKGWIKAADYRADIRIAQFDCSDSSISFVFPSRVYSSDYAGSMLRIRGQQFDMLVTPEHRCLLRRRKSKKYFEALAAEFPVCPDNRIIHAGVCSSIPGQIEDTVLTKDQLRWLIAVQADGSYVNGFDGQGIVFAFAKKRKTTRLLRLLARLQADVSCKRKSRHTTIYVGVTKNRELVALAKNYLGKEKEFGDWLVRLSPLLRSVFVNEIFFWDGSFTRKSAYTSGREKNVDFAQIVFTLSGFRARKRTGWPLGRQHFYLGVHEPGNRRNYTSVKNAQVENVDYTGKIYCVEVPTGFFVVRREGKVVVTGNSKRREPDLKRILGSAYPGPLRSILCAPPGYVLVESDYIGAELFAMAMLSGDPTMLEHARRNQLSEDDPDFYDIHSNVAVLAFSLPCEPTKAGLASIGKKHLRVLSKSVLFGAKKWPCF